MQELCLAKIQFFLMVLLQPETIIRWHRAGFKQYWTWLLRHQAAAGRKSVGKELRELIFHMVTENSTWGAPRIHGELKMLGFDISERTVFALDEESAEES
jgi:hypothetical protein